MVLNAVQQLKSTLWVLMFNRLNVDWLKDTRHLLHLHRHKSSVRDAGEKNYETV